MGKKRGDSIQVYNTRGVFFPTINVWKGNGGTLDWGKVGLDSDEIYCKTKKYEVKTNKSEIRINDVDFYYTSIFNKPMCFLIFKLSN